MSDLNKIQVRLPISRDAAFLLENPEQAAALKAATWPEYAAKVSRELAALAESIWLIRSRLESGKPRERIHVAGPVVDGVQRCVRCRCRLGDADHHWPINEYVLYRRNGARVLEGGRPELETAFLCGRKS